MADVWNRVKGFQGKRLFTLAQRKPFTVNSADSEWVEFTPEDGSGRVRSESRSMIEHIASLDLRPSELRRRVAREYPSSRNSSYVAAIVHEATKS